MSTVCQFNETNAVNAIRSSEVNLCEFMPINFIIPHMTSHDSLEGTRIPPLKMLFLAHVLLNSQPYPLIHPASYSTYGIIILNKSPLVNVSVIVNYKLHND